MKIPTRILAALLTSALAIGLFAVPAAAQSAGNVEEELCDAYADLEETLEDDVAAGATQVTEDQADLVDAANDLDDTSTAAGVAGLAYIQAFDDGENTDAELSAFGAAVTAFGADVTDYVDAVDALNESITTLALNRAILTYIQELCSGPAPTPTPSPTPTPTPSPTPSTGLGGLGGLGELLNNLLGGLLGGL